MRSALFLLLLSSLALVSPDVRVEGRRDHERARAAVAAGEIRPLPDLLAEIERRYAGRVVETELEREDGRWVYEFKVLPPSGKVFEIHVDATTGALLGSHGPAQERR